MTHKLVGSLARVGDVLTTHAFVGSYGHGRLVNAHNTHVGAVIGTWAVKTLMSHMETASAATTCVQAILLFAFGGCSGSLSCSR